MHVAFLHCFLSTSYWKMLCHCRSTLDVLWHCAVLYFLIFLDTGYVID